MVHRMSVSVCVCVTGLGAGRVDRLFLIDKLHTFTGEKAHLKETKCFQCFMITILQLLKVGHEITFMEKGNNPF